jgi:hypothetical protein
VYRVGVQGKAKVAMTDAFVEATPGFGVMPNSLQIPTVPGRSAYRRRWRAGDPRQRTGLRTRHDGAAVVHVLAESRRATQREHADARGTREHRHLRESR